MAALVAHPQDTLPSPSSLSPEQDPTPNKISAYYSLVFPNFTYYLQTLTVTIGRRRIPTSSASSSDIPQVDVDLGPLKSVSRLHAKIEYEEEEERFVLIVLGRNGAWVDGVWSGSGSKVPLSDRSQIQIASRTFHFVLPPPSVPEDSPSPSSHSSDNRVRSPSVDIVDVTSISPPSSLPSCSPPPAVALPPPNKIPPLEAQLPDSNTISKCKPNAKKRRKPDAPVPAPPPEVMPPKPQLTYAQLCYRAIKALGGKASLQDICHWIKETYEWFKYCGKDWESSVRHNLSSNPGFKKLLRSKEEKGKGALWLIDAAFEHTFEEQDARRQATAALGAGGRDGRSAGKKAKAVVPLEPPLKRSVKGDLRGTPLPPPLTSTPLVLKTNATATANVSSASPPLSTALVSSLTTPSAKFEPSSASQLVPPIPSAAASDAPASTSFVSASSSVAPISEASTSTVPAIPATVHIPIVVGPVPASASSTNDISVPKPIVLHDNTLILNPDIFAHLTPTHLADLEALGAQKALEILQSYIVRFYKEKLKAEGGRGRGRGRQRRGRGGGTGRGAAPVGTQSLGSGPFTMAPLAHKPIEPQLISEACGSGDVLVPSHEPVARKVPPSAPMGSLQPTADSAPSPIVVIDDDIPDFEEGPATKRRRLDDTGVEIGA